MGTRQGGFYWDSVFQDVLRQDVLLLAECVVCGREAAQYARLLHVGHSYRMQCGIQALLETDCLVLRWVTSLHDGGVSVFSMNILLSDIMEVHINGFRTIRGICHGACETVEPWLAAHI